MSATGTVTLPWEHAVAASRLLFVAARVARDGHRLPPEQAEACLEAYRQLQDAIWPSTADGVRPEELPLLTMMEHAAA